MSNFICGTNRNNFGVGGVELETLMRERECAAIWEYPPDEEVEVRYISHLKSVVVGDLIFMFASGLGVIGVGKAKGGAIGPISPGGYSRLRDSGWLGSEWQVPVEWIRWQPESPCSIRGANFTFYRLSDPTWTDRRSKLIAHFKLADGLFNGLYLQDATPPTGG